ncbi:hypothetical protein NQZ68_028944, partial [Dissostichus eleginoides]
VKVEIHQDSDGRIMFSSFPDSSLKNSSQNWGNLLPFEPLSVTVSTADRHQGEGLSAPKLL